MTEKVAITKRYELPLVALKLPGASIRNNINNNNNNNVGKGKVHPRTGHEGPQEE